MHSPAPPDRLPTGRFAPLILLSLACLLPEAMLGAADAGWIGSARWRSLAYQYGGFWVGLLHGWQPNFPAQPWTMFLSHAFLHAGPGHLTGNLLAFWALAPQVARQLDSRGLMGLWCAAVLGGGAMFGLLARTAAPMVGASGGLFGLTAALVIWRWRSNRAAGHLCLALLGLAGINLAMWLLAGGALAWQAHLGGALAGGLFALAYPRRPILPKIRA